MSGDILSLLVFLLLDLPEALADDRIVAIEERLTTDREFYDRWMDLISLQANQLAEQTLDYPMDNIVNELNTCKQHVMLPSEHADSIRPSDIAIYAEMGHLSTYCESNVTMLKAGIIDNCRHRGPSMSLPSLDKMLRVWNSNLTVVESNQRDDFLKDQARSIAHEIRKMENSEHVWKLIMIMPTIQDGEASETGQTAVEVLDTLEELNRLLPHKTLVVVLRSSGSGMWHDASHSHKACREMLARYKVHNKFNYNSVWEQVEMIAQKNFKKANFSVEILPLLRDAALTNLPDQMDLSVLGYDCAHLSERGLSLLHIATWNSLFTTVSERSREYRPALVPARCPDPRCPFIRTAENSAYCIWTDFSEPSESIAPHLIVLCVLLITVMLTCIILVCVCRNRHPSKDYVEPKKAFGASFNSIKFIDEDIV